MTKASVEKYLERAREVAALADKKTGNEKKRLMDIAEAWLEVAHGVAADAESSATIHGALPDRSKLN